MKIVRGFVQLAVQSVRGFFSDDALTHGAAMAFYATTSLAPILLIVVAISGLFFGSDAAHLALSAQFSGLMGPKSAELVEAILKNADRPSSGWWATAIGLVALIATASGVFGEMQSALNRIWKVPPSEAPISTMIRARAASLGLVAALGFLLLVSLAVSTAITALSGFLNANLPFGTVVVGLMNTLVSFALVTVMFAAIYKVLPDRDLQWRDVMVGAILTSLLFAAGKTLISWYVGSSATASSYGAAGSLLSVLLWVYYSSAVFLLGAEFTRAYAVVHGSRADLAQMVALGPVATGSTASTDEASTNFAQGQNRSRTFWLAPLTAALVTGFLVGILARL